MTNVYMECWACDHELLGNSAEVVAKSVRVSLSNHFCINKTKQDGLRGCRLNVPCAQLTHFLTPVTYAAGPSAAHHEGHVDQQGQATQSAA